MNGLTFEFGVPVSLAAAALLLALAGAASIAFWSARLRKLPAVRRATLVTLRTLALLLIVFMLLDPTLIGRREEPADDYVVLLFDDSRSMRIAGDDGLRRGERLRREYKTARQSFEKTLREKHHLAMYRFGNATARIASPEELDFDQTESNLLAAISGAVRDLAGAKIAGIVVFSDGVEQGAAAQKALPDAAIPVYPVGVDTEAPWRDLDLKAVSAQRTNFDKSPVSLSVQVSARGLKGRQAVIEAMEGTRVAASKQISIADEAMDATVRLEFIPLAKEWVACEARVRLLEATDINPGERVTENNRRGFIVDNRERPYRILYLAGRPNWQTKFVRRALDEDPLLLLSCLIRISGPERAFKFKARQSLNNPLFEGFDESEVQAPRYDEAHFIRIGLSQDQFAKGYPLEAKELFGFDLVIWGEIEANYFSPLQFEITRDFVAKRGGSLLLLGGPRSLAEGGFAGTMIETMSPVMLSAARETPPSGEARLFKAEPTIDGVLSGVWTLDPDPETNKRLWGELPPLYGSNPLPMTRAGATEMARIASESRLTDGEPLFVWQRYGLGRTAVFATGETWQWRMQEDLDNPAHDQFWRQMVRSLVNDVPAPVMLKSRGEALIVGEPARLEFLVRDEMFDKREGLNTSVRVTLPDGGAKDLAGEESIAETGVYGSELTPEQPGMHVVHVTAMNDKTEVVGTQEEAVYVNPDLREYQNASYRPERLKEIAAATGGKFFGLEQLGELAESIPQLTMETEIPEIHRLWHLPPLFAGLVLLLAAEWYLRRKYGQP